MKLKDTLFAISIAIVAFFAGSYFAMTHQQIVVDLEHESVSATMWGDTHEYYLDVAGDSHRRPVTVTETAHA